MENPIDQFGGWIKGEEAELVLKGAVVALEINVSALLTALKNMHPDPKYDAALSALGK